MNLLTNDVELESMPDLMDEVNERMDAFFSGQNAQYDSDAIVVKAKLPPSSIESGLHTLADAALRSVSPPVVPKEEPAEEEHNGEHEVEIEPREQVIEPEVERIEAPEPVAEPVTEQSEGSQQIAEQEATIETEQDNVADGFKKEDTPDDASSKSVFYDPDAIKESSSTPSPVPDPPLEIFGPDGDLIITVGISPHAISFQVDKGLLRAASTEWMVLLRTCVRDGHWSLPADDPDAFRLALKGAYYRWHEIPVDLSDALLREVARLYHKYGLARCLGGKMQAWSMTLEKRGLETRIMAAWFFGRKEEFEAAWREMVRHVVVEQDGGSMKLRCVRRLEAKDPASVSAAKAKPEKPKKAKKRGRPRIDDSPAPTTVPTQHEGCSQPLQRDLITPLIMDEALTLRSNTFGILSHAYEAILNNLLTTPSFTTNNDSDHTDSEADLDPDTCSYHEQTLFNRLLRTARRKGLVTGTFPMTFEAALSYDETAETVEEFANKIRENVLKAGAGIGYDCQCVETVVGFVDVLVDEYYALPEVLAKHFDAGGGEEPARKKAKMG